MCGDVYKRQDYTTKNGKLIGDHQLQMLEDFKNNIWIASDKGLNRITPDGKSHLVLKNQHIITLTTDGNLSLIHIWSLKFLQKYDKIHRPQNKRKQKK